MQADRSKQMLRTLTETKHPAEAPIAGLSEPGHIIVGNAEKTVHQSSVDTESGVGAAFDRTGQIRERAAGRQAFQDASGQVGGNIEIPGECLLIFGQQPEKEGVGKVICKQRAGKARFFFDQGE